MSSGAGTSDADGRRRWPRSSKKRRKVSRISSAFTADSLGVRPWPRTRFDRAPPHHEVAVHQARGLPGRHAIGGVVEVDLEALGASRRRTGATEHAIGRERYLSFTRSTRSPGR